MIGAEMNYLCPRCNVELDDWLVCPCCGMQCSAQPQQYIQQQFNQQSQQFQQPQQQFYNQPQNHQQSQQQFNNQYQQPRQPGDRYQRQWQQSYQQGQPWTPNRQQAAQLHETGGEGQSRADLESEKPKKCRALPIVTVILGVLAAGFAIAFAITLYRHIMLVSALESVGEAFSQAFTVDESSSASSMSSGSSLSDEGDYSAESDGGDAQGERFDGSAYSDTGAGTFVISTPAGTSEGGNIPQLIVESDSLLELMSCSTEGMDYVKCMVYVDGVENTEMVIRNTKYDLLTLSGAELTSGIHTVELVCMEGDSPSIYKKAQYEVVL